MVERGTALDRWGQSVSSSGGGIRTGNFDERKQNDFAVLVGQPYGSMSCFVCGWWVVEDVRASPARRGILFSFFVSYLLSRTNADEGDLLFPFLFLISSRQWMQMWW